MNHRTEARGALHDLGIAQAAQLIRGGELSPVDLTEACLRRIEAIDDRLHCFITVTADSAREAAKEAEREIRAGRWRGPLHGIPIAYKDMVATRGVRTTAHSNVLRDWIPPNDATVYTRLQEAGAISLGKLSCWEFAYGDPGPTVAFPPARNPWNTDFSAGGSSSGSGAAVAARLCLGAIGTDTGGSIRHPASMCGIVGAMASFGRVSVHGVLPLAPSLDHVGPMTRSVVDNALMLQAMAGFDAQDPNSIDASVPNFAARIGQPLEGLRLAVPQSFIASRPHASANLAAFEAALDTLRALGAAVEPVDLPLLPRAADLGSRILLAEAWAIHKERLASHAHLYDESFRSRLLDAGDQAPELLAEARAVREEFRRELDAMFRSGIAAILNPASEGIPNTMAVLATNPTRNRGSCTRMYNMAGVPAMSVPMGSDELGLPLGLQVASARMDEQRMYQIAAAFESATEWSARCP